MATTTHPYRFAGIIKPDDPATHHSWLPTPATGERPFALEDGERVGAPFMIVHGLRVLRNEQEIFELRERTFQGWLTDRRIVITCDKFDTGGGWISFSPVAWVVANGLSMGRAKLRSRGKLLIGQMRWEWLSAVSYAEQAKRIVMIPPRVRLSAQVGADTVAVDLILRSNNNARAFAATIVETASAHRRENGGVIDMPELPEATQPIVLSAPCVIPGSVSA